MKIDISGEFEIMYDLHRRGFDFTKIGMLLFEVHAFHPQAGGLLVSACAYIYVQRKFIQPSAIDGCFGFVFLVCS